MLPMYKSAFFFLLVILGLNIAYPAVGQQSMTDLKIEHYMKEAKAHMDAGNYEEANLSFRKMLTLRATLPSEMCYYFAVTLYNINQFHNSKNFITKYLNLTGTSGPYYKDMLVLNDLIEEKYKEIKDCDLCDSKGYAFKDCHQCHGAGHTSVACNYCKGKGMTTCMACSGNGVKITENVFKEKEYKACNVCESKGYTTCTVCKGSKIENLPCNTCKGSGALATNQVCTHPTEDSAAELPGL
ncbi:hypothetical protein BH23BAC1_BH23BAC1_33630 [soil metagenome]